MGEVLGREDLLQLLAEDAPLVEHMVDAAAQVQPNGIELTLRSVGRLTEAGAVGVLDHERQVAAAASLEFDAQGWLHLEPGCYRIVYNEVIHMPADMVALARPRSLARPQRCNGRDRIVGFGLSWPERKSVDCLQSLRLQHQAKRAHDPTGLFQA